MGLERLGKSAFALIVLEPCLAQVKGILGQQVGYGLGIERPVAYVGTRYVKIVIVDGYVGSAFGNFLLVVIAASGET